MSIYIYGAHAVQEAIKNPKRFIKCVFCVEQKLQDMQKLCKDAGRQLQIEIVTKAELDKEFDDASHQGMALETEAVTGTIDEFQRDGKIKPAFKKIILLDQLQDLRNIGAIIRTAAAFEFGAVVVSSSANCPNVCQAEMYAQMAKAAAGGLEHVRLVVVGNLASAIEKLKSFGYWIAGLDVGGQNISDMPTFDAVCVVVGQEGDGLRQLTKKSCDLICSINVSSAFDCLNASVAAGIGMYEVSKKIS